MKKFIKTIKKKAQSKGSYDPQEAADSGGASGGTETGYVVREKDLPKLHKAAWTGDLSKVVQLVKKDTSSLDKENRTALHLACARGHADIVKVLLEWHAKSNIGDSESKTPLLKAVECGHDDCVKLLIEHNAQVDTVDREGNSGLHLAVLYNHPKIVKILTEKGANVNIKNKTQEGLAPLHMSIQFKRDEITRALLIAKANPDVQDNLGRTPLMLACYDGSITPVRMLLQFNANTVIKDRKGFTAEDMANMTGQYAAAQLLSDHAMKLRRSTGGSLAGSVTPRETPRGSVGPSSASTTPRDPSLSHFLPADNNDKVEDSDEENTQSRVSHSQQDDSWADDSVSLGMDKKKEDVPKISLAAKLTKFPDSEEEDEDVDDEEYEEDQNVPPSNIPGRQQQSSVKSNQSHTSIEDNIPYDEEEEEEDREEVEEPGRKRTITANRVSFRDESEIREITDDNDTTDIEEDEESGSGAKKPKLDDQQNSSSGYLPTGVSNLSPSASFDKEKQRAFLADLGIDDDVDSGPEISELSDEEPALPSSPPPKLTEVDPDNQESEWDSTQPSVTPRPGILKNWKQASQEEVEKNTKKLITPRSDGSEWDSDIENEVDPSQTTSQWDSTAEDGVTPRVQNMSYFTEMKSKQEESKVTEEVEEDEDNQLSIETDVQKMEPPVPEVKKEIMEPVHILDNQTAAVPKKQEIPLSEDEDEDSDWDSEDDMLPSESAPPVYGVPPAPETKESSQRGEYSVSEDIEEESISEWEIERQQEKTLKANQEKLQKQKTEEEELQRKWEEEQRQAMEEEDRLDEEERRQAMEEQDRLEQIQREAEMSRQQKWEEEERQTQERLRREAEEEQMRESELQLEFSAEDHVEGTQPLSPKSQSSMDSSSGSQKRGVKSPDTPPTVRLNIKPFQSDSSKPPQKEVEEEFMTYESKDDLQAPPAERSFTSVKTKVVKEEVKQVKTGSPPLIDLAPDLVDVEASAKHDDRNVEKSQMSIEKTQLPMKEDVIEVTTSFNTASPRPPPQTSVTEQLHNGYDKDTDIHGGQKSRADGPAFSHNHSLGVNSFNSSPAVNHKRHTPHITAGTSPPNMHSDGMSVDDEDSVDFDFDRPADNMGTYLRGLPGGNYGPYRGIDLPDDDAFSYTSTENGDSMIYQTNSPYGKDVLANMNLSDPGTVLKLQEHMHEQNKRLDQEKNTRMTLDNKIRSLNKERNELLKKIDSLSQMRSSLEQTKLDMEQKIRNLEYNLSEEAEMRKNAETLLTKTKEQLARKEEQFTNELEEKQKTELQMRNLQLDLRTTKNSIKQLEDEKSDLQRQLQNERNARQLQEQFNEDQQKIQQALHSEQIKSEAEKDIVAIDDDDEDSEAENKLEAVDEDRKSANELLRKLRAENNAFKLEIEKQRLRHRDEVTMLSTETEELQSKIDELKNEIKLNEEALSHATIQYNLQTSNLRTEISVINSVLEKERDSKDKLEAELASLKTRYHTNSLELDKAEQARNETERRLQHEKEEFSRQLDTREKEVASLKDNIQGLLHRITNLENKLNLTENELHKTEATLLEKNNMLNKVQKDLNFIQSAHTASEEKCHTEMELHNKLQAKLEQLQEKHTTMQHENLSLKQQVENLQRSIAEQGGDKSLEYTKIIASMQADAEKTKLHWEERNLLLSDQCSRLKEENRNIEARRNQLEQENSRLNNEVADQIRKLSVVEANYQNLEQTKRGMEEEKMRLHMEIEKYREKSNHEREKCIEAQSKYNTVEDQLRRIQEREETNSQKLLNSSANMEAVNKSKSELEESYQNLKLENAKLEAEVKHERQRVEMLQKDLNDSQKVRNSLEALCSNLKTTNSHLEDKLGHATFTELGSDISQYEKQKQDAFVQLEEERRKHRKTIEAKRTAEMKLEAEIEKNTQLQKEVASLKTYLKVAKKRLKNKVESGYVEKEDLERIQREMEARYRMELNRKLEDVNHYLEDQARAREKLDMSRDETEYKIRDDQKKIQEENNSLRMKYEQAVAEKESREMEVKRYRELYESEMQWRMRLSNQLVQTSDKAFTYKSNLEKQRNRALNTLGNLTFSGTLNGQLLDTSRISGTTDDLFTSKLKAELDRSINKHLEAAPHDNGKPVIRLQSDTMNSSFAKSNADYLEVLQRKYLV